MLANYTCFPLPHPSPLGKLKVNNFARFHFIFLRLMKKHKNFAKVARVAGEDGCSSCNKARATGRQQQQQQQ